MAQKKLRTNLIDLITLITFTSFTFIQRPEARNQNQDPMNYKLKTKD